MRGCINHEKKYIIFWSPKCASTTIRHMIHYYDTGLYPLPFENIHSIRNGNELNITYNYDDYTLILVIRNPYDRLLSGVRMFNRNTRDSFDNFMKIKYIEYLLWNYHFIPQISDNGYEYIQKTGKTFDKVYDVNELDKLNDFLSTIHFDKNKYNLQIAKKGTYIHKDDLSSLENYKNIIDFVYKIDFDFFKQCGYNYTELKN